QAEVKRRIVVTGKRSGRSSAFTRVRFHERARPRISPRLISSSRATVPDRTRGRSSIGNRLFACVVSRIACVTCVDDGRPGLWRRRMTAGELPHQALAYCIKLAVALLVTRPDKIGDTAQRVARALRHSPKIGRGALARVAARLSGGGNLAEDEWP